MITEAVMEMLLDIPTFGVVVEAATLTAAYRLPKLDQKALETGHGRIWKKAETMTKDHSTHQGIH